MSRRKFALSGLLIVTSLLPAVVRAEGTKPSGKYFAHPVAEDRYGVIAPWYRGLNGQCDFRVRIAAETLKRYPWADTGATSAPGPHFIFNGHWGIHDDGSIVAAPNLSDWDNGDIGQRSASLLFGLAAYYRYSGDPAAIGLITLTADHLLDYCQTPADHPWPGFPISAPTRGKAHGRADPHGFIQLDLSAQLGSGMLVAYKLTGRPRYLEAVHRWADLLAEHCDHRDGARPWNRYANPEDCKWDTRQTAGVAFVLQFLNEVIRSGYEGKNGALLKARQSGEKYLRDVLLPQWSADRTFGHHFWDWEQPVLGCSLPCVVAEYMMDRRQVFPDWKSDIRNVISLCFCRTSVDAGSAGGVYSGAWAFPESTSCCGKSLQYPIMAFAAALARYGELADCPWARELARRQAILCSYDARETGVVEDGIDGGQVVTGQWFNLAHPWPLRSLMEILAWQPDLMGANRENHIMRSSSVVRTVQYRRGRIAYSTSEAAAEDVLRLAFPPTRITADGHDVLPNRRLRNNSYTLQPLSNGDYIVTLRHDGCRDIVVEGDDPQQEAEDDQLQYAGNSFVALAEAASGGKRHAVSQRGAEVSFAFEGNQVRLIGRADPKGGKADVYLDGVKQLCGIDFWCPETRQRQVLCYKNGLAQGRHVLRVVVQGSKNPYSQGTYVYVDGVQWSAAQGECDFGQGRGPTGPQRVIFGYTGRKDYVDSQGSSWRPATEFVMRLKTGADLVPVSFWTGPRLKEVAGTADAELYRYGVHGHEFTAYFTVAPAQSYYLRLKFCQAELPAHPGDDATSVEVQGRQVVADMDIPATAGGLGRAVDLVLNDVRPEHGIIAVRFFCHSGGDAMVQAIEVGPGATTGGANPLPAKDPQSDNRRVSNEKLRVATFRCDVTPPLGFLTYPPTFKPLEKIEHPLLAKGIVLDDGGRRYVLCAVDWCGICNSTYDLFRRKVAEAAATDPSRVAVHTIHQHTAPLADNDAYKLLLQTQSPPVCPDLKFFEKMADRIGAAVRQSLGQLQPFDRIGSGQGKVDRVASTRRLIDKDGKVHHPRWSLVTGKDLFLRDEPEGLIDPLLKTITLAQGNKPLVRLHYYATHPQSYFHDPRVTYDFPGMAREALEKKEGVFQVYFTGCAGDILVGKYNDGTPATRDRFSQRLLAGMEAAIAATRMAPVESIEWRSAELKLPLYTGRGRTIAENRARMNDPRIDAGVRLEQGAMFLAYAGRLDRALLLSSLQIGRVHILDLPGECLVDYQLFAQRSAPGEFVAVAAYGDLGPGYICTDKAFEEGGYEPTDTAVGPGSEPLLKAAILKLLGGK